MVVQPGDHPSVALQTLKEIVGKAIQEQSAVAPRYGSHNGHPIAIPTQLARTIVAADLPEGLSNWFRSKSSRRLFVDVDDSSVVFDVDTLEDLQRVVDTACD